MPNILIVEDDPLVALMLEGYLDALGYGVAGPAASNEAALELVEKGQFDAAIIDIHLANGEISGPVASALRTAGKPFLVMTGQLAALDRAFDCAPLIPKPFTIAMIEAALAGLFE